jgi:hypothetical protein
LITGSNLACAKFLQTVWKQFRLSGDNSRKLLSVAVAFGLKPPA